MHSIIIIIIHVGLPECNNLDNVRMSPQHTIKAGINCGYCKFSEWTSFR